MTTSGSIGADLAPHLHRALADAQPGSRWVMNPEWRNECRRMDDTGTGPIWCPALSVTEPDFLFGLPVEVRDDGGVPHLED